MAAVPDAGTWYAGINGDDAMECKFTLSINKFDCPLNCSGRGRCIHNTNGTHTCQCDEVRTSPGGSLLCGAPADLETKGLFQLLAAWAMQTQHL